MNNFNFYSPTFFVFGKERENEAGKYVKRFGGTRVLLHFGGGSVIKSGLLDRVKESLATENIYCTELGGVMPNPRSGLVYKGIEICNQLEIKAIVGSGGLKIIPSFSCSNCSWVSGAPLFTTLDGLVIP